MPSEIATLVHSISSDSLTMYRLLYRLIDLPRNGYIWSKYRSINTAHSQLKNLIGVQADKLVYDVCKGAKNAVYDEYASKQIGA